MSRPVLFSVRQHTPGITEGCAGAQTLGPYSLCRELASGGMATVYLARSDAPGSVSRVVALKVIHRHLARCGDFVAMFSDEARLCSQLEHRNVCKVLGFEAHVDTPYLAMEYLLGESLSAVWQRTSLAPGDLTRHAAMIARVAADACSGLHAAHTLKSAKGEPLNVVHRDVSPDNLFVTYSGVTKVVDFGLASAKHQTHRSQSGMIKGKFAYVSPEALTGAKVGRKADIWSLGVVVWELLTGQRLFRAETDLQTLAAVAEASIPPPSSVRKGLPKELDAPVLRALSRKPSERPQTAAQFRAELLAACPRAASLDEAEVGAWMLELFPEEQRDKRDTLSHFEAIGTDACRTSLESVSLPLACAATVRLREPPPSSLRKRAKFCVDRRHWGFAAAMLGLLIGAAALSQSSMPVTAAPRPSLPRLSAENGAARRAPAPAPALELEPERPLPRHPDSEGGRLEMATAAPDSPRPAMPTGRAGAALTATARRSAGRSSEASKPPAWLREVMERQRASDPIALACRLERRSARKQTAR